MISGASGDKDYISILYLVVLFMDVVIRKFGRFWDYYMFFIPILFYARILYKCIHQYLSDYETQNILTVTK